MTCDVWFLDFESANIIKISSNVVLNMLLSPDNKSLLTVCEKSLVFIDPITLQETHQIRLPEDQSFDDSRLVAFSSKGDLIVTLTLGDLQELDPATIILWDGKTGSLIASSNLDYSYLICSDSIAFTPNADSVIIDGHYQWNFNITNRTKYAPSRPD